MFNKYKVAIADVEDTPSCDKTDITCGKIKGYVLIIHLKLNNFCVVCSL